MPAKKTRFKDGAGQPIYIGDILHVEEYPDRYVGGGLDYDGVVTEEDGTVMVTYLDIGESESSPLSLFPRRGRRLFSEEEAKKYWTSLFLGAEPPEHLYKRELRN